MRIMTSFLLVFALMVPDVSAAYTPISPYSTRGGLPGAHRTAGYGASHKAGVYTANGRTLRKFDASKKK